MNKDISVITWGGIGDVLVCTPTFSAIREAYRNHRLIVYCGRPEHRDVLLHNPNIDEVRLVSQRFIQSSAARYLWRYPADMLKAFINKKDIKYYTLYFQHIPPTWLYNKSVKEIVPEIFADLSIDLKDTRVQMFFTEVEERKARFMLAPFKKVVLLHVFSKASVNHHWPKERWEQLVTELPECTFIQLGTAKEPSIKGAIDWRGKTTLREANCLLKYAASFVGVDSSLSHATNAFGLPGVVLFGDSSPVYWGHDNNINIYKGIECSPCFYYLRQHACPYGHECMNLITVEEVRNALRLQVDAGAKRLSLMLN